MRPTLSPAVASSLAGFPMRPLPHTLCLLALAAALAACDRQPSSSAAVAAAPVATPVADHIAWRQGDVDDAFVEARESGRPVLLYWGAVWCPPCNRLKATLFKDPAFIALTGNFVP